MSDTHELGAPPDRVVVELRQVRDLVRTQFPRWAHLPIEPVANGGWDNYTFHLGTDMVLRLPSASEYAQAVEKEHRWLPVLASSLPLPIPVPLAQGAPSADYPYPWSVYQWLDGHAASADRVGDPATFAGELATFLLALQAVDATPGPQPGLHNWFRGGPLRTYDANTRRALRDLRGHIDVDLAARAWDDALSAPWDGVDRWFHGDVAAGNLLLDDAGRLSAVIDFGTCGVGDPACDLAVAWTLLTTDGRHAFRERLAVDDPTWQRGRGWALWKTVATCWSNSEDPDDAEELDRAKQTLDVVLAG
ncbi:aminoglycoside phosphotransferase family protein [Nocardioides sp.]|uniref:aminoglycoside phosphotransferase family protein n=1 Tax=Nocardioides sp. TaxID=35761 RepID=UPI002D00B3BE|nr:aminoglycoside phosphotransferase family protein [Nocardioides sp.]HXH78187.1 aminoglycoside phosphotransferase family protein [Nocardioides sp.]